MSDFYKDVWKGLDQHIENCKTGIKALEIIHVMGTCICPRGICFNDCKNEECWYCVATEALERINRNS